MIKEAIYGVMNGEDLSFEMAKTVMDEIMEGRATNAQIGSFLTAMRMKGESIEEITACATVMRNHCTKLRPAADVLDIVGTGGDEAYTFNISTVSALVIAAAGVPVAKHGNRSVSSKCGSADLLEALGVKIGLSAAQSEQVLARTGICFMFAPTFHASMKYAAPVRKELGARTIFNILGRNAAIARRLRRIARRAAGQGARQPRRQTRDGRAWARRAGRGHTLQLLHSLRSKRRAAEQLFPRSRAVWV